MTTNDFRKRLLGAGSALQVLALIGAGAAVAGIAAAPAAAQDITSGRLTGQVTDETGNPVPNATLTIESLDRGSTRTVVTSDQGSFNVPQIPVGAYNVTISADGFDSVRAENVAIGLGGNAYNFGLTAASSEGNVIVVSASALRTIDFSGTATGIVVNAQEIASRLPVGRNIEAIQLLAPQTTSGDTAFGGISLAGSSVAENIFYINGMNITNFRTGVGGTTVPFEFYDQIQVKTGGYQAEFGRNTGGAVIALSRSGSNEFHGGANIYFSPDSLRSDSPDTYIQENSADRRETVEGNIWASGPLIKDRLFFFGFFNPRNVTTFDKTLGTTQNPPGDTTATKRDKPFYGGKLDLNLFDGHRLEATYFNDSQDETVLFNGAPTTNFSGGENYIFSYSGTFTDWLSVSALYGKSKFNQTSAGSDDAVPYVVEGRFGGARAIKGNPNGTIDTGNDTRENYRIDADMTFSLLGDHNIRFGYDHEKLTASNVTIYSGGIYYRYYRTGATAADLVTGSGTTSIAPNTDYIRVRKLESGGVFNSENTAFYIQDSWDVTDRLNLSLGVRNDHFKNLNAAGVAFTDLKNQWAPRVGVNYDLTGDGSTRLTAFYGRYYLPVAANTNIRLAGAELFTEDYYLLGSQTYTGDVLSPTLGTKIGANVLSDGTIGQASTLVSKNIKPQYLDEFILGAEHRFDSGWTASITGTYRTLGAVLEDFDIDGSGSYRSLIDDFCNTQTLAYCNPGVNPTVNGGGYILLNPGSDLIVDVEDAAGALHEVTLPNSFLKLDKAKRKYWALEFKAERPFDGTWGISGSYVLGSSKGNYEGGVKSDNGQDDTGLTQDFDELGWLDGASGYLPNHRRHTFKLYGTYSPIENLLIGFNGLVQSPRKFGCIGTYPLSDGRASGSLAASWYCDAQIKAGVLQGTVGQPIGRGNALNSDWLTKLDLSASYKFKLGDLAGLTLRADVFNVFNSSAVLDLREFGDKDSVGVIDDDYGKPTGYQAPRSVRFSASFEF